MGGYAWLSCSSGSFFGFEVPVAATLPEIFTTYSLKTIYSLDCQSDNCPKLRNIAAHPLRLPSSKVHRTLGLRLHSVISILGMFGICIMHLLRCELLEIGYYVSLGYPPKMRAFWFPHQRCNHIFGLRLHSVMPCIYIMQIPWIIRVTIKERKR